MVVWYWKNVIKGAYSYLMANGKEDRQTFSEFYNLNKSQLELDFVDVPVTGQDIRLFIDPYAISRRQDAWFQNCSEIIYSYFDHLLDLIRLNKRADAMRLLDGLHESNETRLGYSPRNKGAAIGQEQSRQLYEALRKSKAVETGVLKDIEECNLLIPGVNRDKISDITTNIIKKSLIEYTQQQCELHGIPLALKLPVRHIFNPVAFDWLSEYVELPADMAGKPIILVPKTIVRIIPSLNADEYYSKHILEFLMAENYSASSSLCRVLQDGTVKPPFKKTLTEEVTKVGDPKEGLRSKKDYIYDFTLKHPQVLEEYEDSVRTQDQTLTDEQIERRIKKRPQSYTRLANSLKAIPPGSDTAHDYHNKMIGVLSAVFSPLLTGPKKEAEINEGIKRIDIRMNNSAQFGFFTNLRPLKGIPAPYVYFECKNYSDDVKNPEVDQLAMRFGPHRGQLGFLLCRKIDNRQLLLKRCRAAAKDGHGWVIPLTDKDIFELLDMKQSDDSQGIDAFLEARLVEIIN